MERLNRIATWAEHNRDLLLEVVRIYLGIGLFLKGVFFASHADTVVSLLNASQIDVPGVLLAHVVAGVHLAFGLMLAAGLLTRVAAWVQVPILLGAVFVVHLREGLFGPSQNLEFAVLVLVLLVLFGVSGGGRWSSDYLMAKRQRKLTSGTHLSGTA